MAKAVQCTFKDGDWVTHRWVTMRKAQLGAKLKFKSMAEYDGEEEREWTIVEIFDRMEVDDKYIYYVLK